MKSSSQSLSGDREKAQPVELVTLMMIDSHTRKITALLPMRHYSERVQGKNYRSLAGKPLYHYILETLLMVPEIGRVVVDTDSPIILDELPRKFPGVLALERPEHLCAGDVPMNDVLLHTTSKIKSDWYLQTHSTNPLLSKATISDAIRAILASPDHDSLFSVTRLQTRLWRPGAVPVNHDPDRLLRTQDLPPIYEENSCIYIFQRETLVARGNRLGAHPLMFEIRREEALDIDEEFDFWLAESIMLRKNRARGRSLDQSSDS